MDEDFNTYDYTENYNLPYPNDNQENIDLIENLKKLAEAVDSAIGGATPQNMEVTTNKVTSLSSSSTDVQYPSAKCVYDFVNAIVGDIGEALDLINGESVGD